MNEQQNMICSECGNLILTGHGPLCPDCEWQIAESSVEPQVEINTEINTEINITEDEEY